MDPEGLISLGIVIALDVSFIEEQLEKKGYAVGTFLDIEGAFNNTPHEVVCEEAARRGVPEKIVEWIKGMLKRQVTASLGTVSVSGWVERGCPQGGVLSPLLWCLVADSLLGTLNERGILTLGYADDLAILVRGPFLETLLELTQGALEVVEEWCGRTGLSVNPLKTGLVVFTRKYKVGPVEGPVLGGTRLVPTGTAKYLGVILDRKLAWREHLENRCKSVCSYFWICRRTFGQTWGLKPRIVHWIYTAILRPRLLYASVVWWPRVLKKTAASALEHIRALVLRGALGAMRTTPVAAMGMLLGIEPLDRVVVAAAAAAAYRLRCESRWRAGALHTRFPEGILSGPIFAMGQDRRPVIRTFERRYKISFPKRWEWDGSKGPVPRDGDVWFTDGSGTSTGSGAGLYCQRDGARMIVPLGEHATVFQAEVVAIMRCAQNLLELGRVGGRIRICSDSQAALKALEGPRFNSRLVWDCKIVLDELAKNNDVGLVWVPGHSGIEGNEIADLLAKEAAETRLVGPEPAVGISFCLGRRRIGSWLRDQHLEHWRKVTGVKCRQAGALLGDCPGEDLARSMRSLNRRDARLATQLLTGHGDLNYHLYKLGSSDTPDCRWCGEEEETSLHILGNCPVLVGPRARLLGSGILEPDQVGQLPLEDLLRFWKEAGPR
ncbi:uncharacterized protein LOC118644432 [Monomorium pharaonis]|uniref:uncharacterized protein LOC118644432 n=2 Tax=Monomorium pharaonis TaxID=307658 RepID=UPI001746C432|nr:uncharacterized protein LOC118644432 [Monomorium pharaonis]